MKKLGRFLTLHGHVVSCIIYFIALFICIILMLQEKLSPLSAILAIVLSTLLPFFILNFITIYFYSKPLVDTLDVDRDPYPLLEETERLLPKAKKGLPYLNNIINYSAALIESGQYEKALAILQSVDFSKIPKTPPQVMLYYYNNLCAACDKNGLKEQASVYYSKAQASYSTIKNEALKKQMKNAITLNTIEEHLRNEDYTAADKLLSTFMPTSNRQNIDVEMFRAKVHIGLGEAEKAKEHLEFVIENGNKLYAVTEAREILASL